LSGAHDAPATPAVVAGSFRDREGRVYRLNGRILRGLSARALQNFQALRATGFYARACAAGTLISSTEVNAADSGLPAEVQEQWAGFIEHPALAFISYPYK